MDKDLSPNNPKDNSQESSPWFPNRWRDRLLAFSLWGIIVYINTDLFVLFPPPELIRKEFQLGHFTHRWAAYLVVVVILIVWLRLRFLWFIIYFLLFPIFVVALSLWYFAQGIIKLTGWQALVLTLTSGLSALGRLFGKSPRITLITLGVIPSCYTLIFIFSGNYFLYPIIILLLLATVRIVWGAFQWVQQPLNPFTWFVDKFFEFSNKRFEGATFNLDSTNPTDTKKIESKTKELEFLIEMIDFVKTKLVTPKSVITMFLVVLVFVLFITILNFAFVYYGLNEINSQHFRLQPDEIMFWDFWYFSFSVMTTSDLSTIETASRFAQAISVLEVICTIGLLSLLLLVFSTVGYLDMNEAVSRLDRHVAQQKEYLSLWSKLVKNPPLLPPSN